MEDNIVSATPLVHSNTISEFDFYDLNDASSSNQQQCSSTIEKNDYSQLTTGGISQAINEAFHNAQNDAYTPLLLYPDDGNVLQTLIHGQNRKRYMLEDKDACENEWNTEKNFK